MKYIVFAIIQLLVAIALVVTSSLQAMEAYLGNRMNEFCICTAVAMILSIGGSIYLNYEFVVAFDKYYKGRK